MRKQFSEQTEYTHRADPSTYQTGHTAPPKYYRGVIAVLMMAVIFLLGLASALGVINVRLLLKAQHRDQGQAPVSLYANGTSATTPTGITAEEPPQIPREPSVEVPLQEPVQQAQPSREQILQTNEKTTVRVDFVLPSGELKQLPGVIVDRGGYILTGFPVSQAKTIIVTLSDGSTYPAAFVAADGFTSQAVIYIRAENLTAAEFVNSDRLNTGDFLGAVAEDNALSSSALQTTQHSYLLGSAQITLLQTGLDSFHGPLYNANGQIAGIGVPFLEDCCGKDDGLALSSASATDIVEQLIRYGFVLGRPDLGIQLEALEASHQRYFRLPSGLLVTQGDEDGILRPGDVLTGINGQAISDWNSYYRIMWHLRVGDPVRLTVFRDGQFLSVELIVGQTGL